MCLLFCLYCVKVFLKKLTENCCNHLQDMLIYSKLKEGATAQQNLHCQRRRNILIAVMMKDICNPKGCQGKSKEDKK